MKCHLPLMLASLALSTTEAFSIFGTRHQPSEKRHNVILYSETYYSGPALGYNVKKNRKCYNIGAPVYNSLSSIYMNGHELQGCSFYFSEDCPRNDIRGAGYLGISNWTDTREFLISAASFECYLH